MSQNLPSLVGVAAAPAAIEQHVTNTWSNLFNTHFGLGDDDPIVRLIARAVVILLILVTARLLVSLMNGLVARGVAAAIKRTSHGQRRLTTLQGLLSSTLAYAIYFVAILQILFVIGFTTKALAPLLGAASILAMAIGFGAQRLVRDVITGLFILGEGQFDVGDSVVIGGVEGTVEDIGLRVTRLRDVQGREYIIANGDITQVFNASRGAVKLSIEVALQHGISLDAELSAVHQAAVEALQEFKIDQPSAAEFTQAEPAVTVVNMEAAKVTVRLVIWVPVTQRVAVEDAIRRKLLKALAENPVDISLA